MDKMINKKRFGKKGQLTPAFIVLGVIVIAGFIMLNQILSVDEIAFVGKTQVKIVNGFEASERMFQFIDVSSELAAKYAYENIAENAGYLINTFQGNKVKPKCGTIIYPVLNKEGKIDDCKPDFEASFANSFPIQLNKLINKHPTLRLTDNDFIIKDVGSSTTDFRQKVIGQTDMGIPVYSFVESYYAELYKNRGSDGLQNNYEYYENDQGYLEYRGLYSYPRGTNEITKVIIHDTVTRSFDETHSQLEDSTYNYHYVIDKEGRIYNLADESRATKNLLCEQEAMGCVLKDDELSSISIALISCSYDQPSCSVSNCFNNQLYENKCWETYTNEQIESLSSLIADISIRNSYFEISANTIFSHEEITPGVNNPSKHFNTIKNKIILDSAKKKQQKIVAQQSQTTSIVNKPTEEFDIEKATPTYNGNIITSVYYTPYRADYSTWSTGGTTLRDKYGTWCNIPENQKGFYEAVMCVGFGRKDNKVYTDKIIKQKEEDSAHLTTENELGEVDLEKRDPKTRRTVMVSKSVGTCTIPLGAKLYIYFGEDSSYNGYYVAEDNGELVEGSCIISIFTGLGKQSSELAKTEVIGKRPKIFLLNPDFEIPKQDFSAFSNVPKAITGSFESSYSHIAVVEDGRKTFINAYSAAQGFLNSCRTIQTQSEYDVYKCLEENVVEIESANNLDIDIDCSLESENLVGYESNNILSPADVKDSMEVATFKGKLVTRSGVNNRQKTTEFPYDKYATMTLKDEKGLINMEVFGDALTILNTLNAGDEITIINAAKGDNTKRYISSLDAIKVNAIDGVSRSPKELTIELAECKTSSKDSCLCEINFGKSADKLIFTNESITFIQGNFSEKYDLTLNILDQDTSIPGIITGKEAIQFEVNLATNSLLKFKKDADSLIYVRNNDEQNLETCGLKRQYVTFCMRKYDPNKISAFFEPYMQSTANPADSETVDNDQNAADSNQNADSQNTDVRDGEQIPESQSVISSLTASQLRSFETTKTRLENGKLSNGNSWMSYVEKVSNQNNIPISILLGLITQESNAYNYEIQIPRNTAIGITQVEAWLHMDGIKDTCGAEYVSECSICGTNVKECCKFEKFHDDVTCQLDYAVNLLKQNYNIYSNDATYARAVQSSCSDSEIQQKYLAYIGWDRALRAYNGFGCKEEYWTKYVDYVHQWAQAWQIVTGDGWTAGSGQSSSTAASKQGLVLQSSSSLVSSIPVNPPIKFTLSI